MSKNNTAPARFFTLSFGYNTKTHQSGFGTFDVTVKDGQINYPNLQESEKQIKQLFLERYSVNIASITVLNIIEMSFDEHTEYYSKDGN